MIPCDNNCLLAPHGEIRPDMGSQPPVPGEPPQIAAGLREMRPGSVLGGAAACHRAWAVCVLVGQGAQPHSTTTLYPPCRPLGSTDPGLQKREGANCEVLRNHLQLEALMRRDVDLDRKWMSCDRSGAGPIFALGSAKCLPWFKP